MLAARRRRCHRLAVHAVNRHPTPAPNSTPSTQIAYNAIDDDDDVVIIVAILPLLVLVLLPRRVHGPSLLLPPWFVYVQPVLRCLFCLWYSAYKSMISIFKVYFVLTFVFEVEKIPAKQNNY